jgi:hypothetical protein
MTQSTQSLASLYAQHQGKVSDKWSSYLTLYETELKQVRHTVRSILEIGVQNGGSLEIWAKYFPAAESIVGCDVNSKCANLVYTDPRIHIVVGDATQSAVCEQVASFVDGFDLIVEDGSHIPREVILAFLRYWPHVKPGGIFIAEDLHCDYFPSHEGGIARRDIANRFFSELVHLLNLEHWVGATAISALLREFAPTDVVDQAGLATSIASISFHNSIAIIRKVAQPTDGLLGARVIVGEEAIADPSVLALKAAGGDSLHTMRTSTSANAAASTFATLFARQ